MEKNLEIKNLCVTYGHKSAVSNLNLILNYGDILGFVGTNGAGKSSTIKSIMSLVDYTGDITVLGRKTKGDNIYKKNIGYIPEDIQIFGGFKGIEYLTYVGGLQGISPKDTKSRCEVMIKYFSLDLLINIKIIEYSKGNKQKLAIVASMIHRPKILILDEPLDGLDPYSIEIFKIILKLHVKSGGSVLYSSHILEVVSTLSNRIVVISKGEIIRDSTLKELQKESLNNSTLNEIFSKLNHIESYEEAYIDLKGALYDTK